MYTYLFTFAHDSTFHQDIMIYNNLFYAFHRNTKRSMANLWRTSRHWMSTLARCRVTVSASKFPWWKAMTSKWPSGPPWTYVLNPATSGQIDTSGLSKRGTNASVLTVMSDIFAGNEGQGTDWGIFAPHFGDTIFAWNGIKICYIKKTKLNFWAFTIHVFRTSTSTSDARFWKGIFNLQMKQNIKHRISLCS